MKNLLAWTKEPITKGGYLKMLGISALISVLGCGIYLLTIWWDEVKEFFAKRFKRNKTEN